jgi:NADP-dependent 3-hydroxy acid dehydrogenase YdfG
MGTPFGHIAITGGSSGLGAALATAHAVPGVRLSLAARNAERLADVAERCRARGADVATAVVDVTDAPSVETWIANADAVQPIDLIYANAGIGGASAIAGVAGEPMPAAHAMIATNLIGVVNTVGPALDCFCARRQGHIVLIGSLAGRLGLPHSPVYCATKAAVATYADGVRRLAALSSVHVTLVEPGFVDTPMSQGLTGRILLWSAQRAAERICIAVQARDAVLRFPLSISSLLHIARHLPPPILDVILSTAYQRGRTR